MDYLSRDKIDGHSFGVFDFALRKLVFSPFFAMAACPLPSVRGEGI